VAVFPVGNEPWVKFAINIQAALRIYLLGNRINPSHSPATPSAEREAMATPDLIGDALCGKI
jgi:hypothetical protein